MSDVCLEGLSHGNIEVSQLRLGGKKRRKPNECTESDEVGKAWTVINPTVLKEWSGEK